METAPAIDKAVDFFDAHTVELYPDVRLYNAAEEEFAKARTDRVSKRFQSPFAETVTATGPYADGEADELF